MGTLTRTKRAGALTALAAAAALALPGAASASPGYVTTSTDKLLKINVKSGKVLDRTALELPEGTRLVGIDQRPANGRLYGIGDDENVYRINPGSGAATAIDDGNPLTPTGFGNPINGAQLDGARFGVDFNPTVDAIRIVSDAAQNLRVSVADGSLISEDPDLNGGNGEPRIVSGAYTESQPGPAPEETALYVLDAKNDRLYRQNPPDDGTLTEPQKLRFNVTASGGFDIAGARDVGYVATASKSGSRLYRLNIESGESKLLGKIGGEQVRVDGLAVRQSR